MTCRHLTSIGDFSTEEIHQLLQLANRFKKQNDPELLKGKILASCFFEPSTRTKLSFESAMIRLGGSNIGFSDPTQTSQSKGESLRDTISVIQHYADVIVIRHPLEGAAQWAADWSSIPIINAGDGGNQHPTQTLLDLFTIQECQGSLNNLHITLGGDLKYGRTVHSLLPALLPYKPRLYLVTPPELELPESYCDLLRANSIKYSYHKSLDEVIPKTDILYMTRVQHERLKDHQSIDRLRNHCVVTPKLLENAKPNLKILHPLPRLIEIDTAVDQTPFAYYFQQSSNGIFVRQALLATLLNKVEIVCPI